MLARLLAIGALSILTLSVGLQPAGAQSSDSPNPPALIPLPSNTLWFLAANSQLIQVSDPNGGTLEVEFYTRPMTGQGENFSIAVLPDTQNYTNRAPAIFTAQTAWIVEHQAERNIRVVFHVGDMVESNDREYQWQNANHSMALLGDIPHGVAVGNHDQAPAGDADGATDFFNAYFGLDRFTASGYYGDHYGGNNDNSYILFSASGYDFVVIFIEYSLFPQPDVIAWADAVMQANSERYAIVVSHAIIDDQGAWSLQGQAFYDGFKDNANLLLMLCGHYLGQSRRSDTFNGHTIHTLMANYQALPDAQSGYLRLLEFQPVNGRVQVKTYSPYQDQDLSDDANEFSLPVELRQPFIRQATLRDVPSGAILRMDFTGLDPTQTYEWYITVSDGHNGVTGPVWQFKADMTYRLAMPSILNDVSFRVMRHFRMPEGRYHNLIAN